MEKISKAIDAFTEAIGTVLSYAILPMIAIVLYTAIMRYIFKTSVPWGFEGAIFLFGTLSIAGGAIAHLHKSHVTVDALVSRLSPRANIFFAIFSQLVIFGVCLCMIYLGSRWAYRSTLIWERSIHGTEWNPYVWWFKWVVPLSTFLVALQCVSEIIKQWLALRMPKGE